MFTEYSPRGLPNLVRKQRRPGALVVPRDILLNFVGRERRRPAVYSSHNYRVVWSYRKK